MAKENEKKAAKLEAKREAAVAKKQEINEQIEALRLKILDEKDEKVKAELRKEKNELNDLRSGIVITDEKVVIPMPKKKKKTITAVISIVLVIALLFGYVASGLAKHGFISTLGYPQRTFSALVLTDADGKKHGIKVDTFNYYYANYYNNLKQQQQYLAQLMSGGSTGDQIDFEKPLKDQKTKDDDGKEITWDKKVYDTVVDNIKHTYAMYYAAVKANNGKEPDITEEQQKEIDEGIDTVKGYAKEAKYTLDAYLSVAVGYGVNVKTLQREGKIQAIAETFESNYQYSDDEYNEYRKAHEDDLKGVDIMYFEAENEDDAKAFVKALKADGSNFAALASKYADSDWDKQANKNPNEVTYYNMTQDNLKALGGAIGTADEHAEESKDAEAHDESEEHTYSGLNWLFSKDRKKGDVKNYSTTVVYVLKPAYLYDGKTVNVRHILIQPEEEKKEDDKDSEEETEESGNINASEATEKQLAAAKKKADEVLAEYNKGAKTVDAFAELAKKYSTDGNASTGGQYEGVYTNQMVPTFNNWVFDSSRKAGDVEIVLTEFGYHIIYFEGQNDLDNWKAIAKNALAADENESSLKKLTENAKIKKSFPGSRYMVNDLDMN